MGSDRITVTSLPDLRTSANTANTPKQTAVTLSENPVSREL